MRVLLLNTESIYYGGTEVQLGRLVAGLAGSAVHVTVACVAGSPLARALPPGTALLELPANQPFSLGGLRRQLRAVGEGEFDLLHGWGARSWELTSLAGAWWRRPTLGTLHDHPQAEYVTARRQQLARWCARFGLDHVTVVSHALRDACVAVGWPARKLSVIHNGLPASAETTSARKPADRLRLGFLGSLSEGKGLRDLLAAMAELERRAPGRWELHVAGTAQDAASETLVQELTRTYSASPWWARVTWRGWVRAEEFLREIDVLVFPSRTFETFGLAPAEAALAGVPTVAARVGAVPEVVVDGRTGWLFAPGDVPGCAALLHRLADQPAEVAAAGQAACTAVRAQFPVAKMIASYAAIYSARLRNGH
ncbi:MAG: hypothetical protein RL514_493 [Verrucomicrobiota bacterium]